MPGRDVTGHELTERDVLYVGPDGLELVRLGRSLFDSGWFQGDLYRIKDLYSTVAQGLLAADTVCFVSAAAGHAALLAFCSWASINGGSVGPIVFLHEAGHCPDARVLERIGVTATLSTEHLSPTAVRLLVEDAGVLERQLAA